MSKAEKFIQENTKEASNATFFEPDEISYKVDNYYSWLTPNEARMAVGIARAEMFEKMKFYIESMVSDITFSDIDGNDNYNLNEFIKDLEQAMKDE